MDDADDYQSSESESVQLRVSHLEGKVQEQADEIASLKSTVGDVLRRISQLEGRVPVLTGSIPSPGSSLRRSSSGVSLRSSNGSSPPLQHHHNHNHNNSPMPRQPTPPYSPSPWQAPTNRPLHYQSTSALNNTQVNGRNGQTTPPLLSGRSSVRQIVPPSRQISLSVSNLAKLKKFSGSQETVSSISSPRSRPPSGSFFNLNNRLSSPVPGTQTKHGTKDSFVNADEGTVKMYLRGRPVIMHIPTEYLMKDYLQRKVHGAPQQRLKLEWVYGYRGRDCRSNLFLLPTGEILYFIAAVIVLYNVEDQNQRHYLEHSDDIKCITVHPNKLLVASGQVGGMNRRNNQPHVRVWDSVSLHTLHVIGQGELERSACCIAFSRVDGGQLLCIVDESSEHTISLWEWQKGESGLKVTETKSSSDTVLAVEFHPMDRYSLVTLGKGHVFFWDTEGGTLAKKLGIFDKHEKPKYILCMAFSETGDLLTGDSNGNIVIWGRGSNRVSRMVLGAHEGGVFSVCPMKDGTFLTGGGKDRKILEWDTAFTAPTREAKVMDSMGGIRSLTQGKGNSLLIGTVRNCILQGSLSLGFSPVVQGHIEDVLALAVHPTQNQFLSGGLDKTIHMWDTMAHAVVWSKEMPEAIHSGCFSPDGSVLVVAMVSGQWAVMDTATKRLYSMHADGNEAISVLKFSPDGKCLALGSHDNYVYVYQVSDNFTRYNRIGRCTGHSSYITHLDWSEDSVYIQTTSGDYELLYWNASVCRQVSNMSIARDIKWQTQSCTLGFSVYGIWPESSDGTDINSCDRSHSGRLLITGDDFGKVNLYSYPACQAKCLHHIYSGHSSHVTRVGFLPDDLRAISTGGRDYSILQWALV